MAPDTAMNQDANVDDYATEAEKKEKAMAYSMEMEQKMQLFGAGLHRQYDEQVALKEEVEQRWLDDLRAYNGRMDRETETKLSNQDDKARGSRIVVNLTRAKTNLAESKFADLVLPTDDRNWGIKPTPVPMLVKSLDDDSELKLETGETVTDPETEEAYTKADHARAVMKEAKDRCEAMQSEIDDQFVEARYASKCRDIIHDACLYGIGVLKGPLIEKRNKRAWMQDGEDGEWSLDYKTDNKPTVDRVDPWNFFPDMSATRQQDWEFTYERHLKTPKQLRKLAKQPGFFAEQIRLVLAQKPNARTAKLSYLNELREMNGISQIDHDNRYEVIEYRGPINKTDLIACGCKSVKLEDDLEAYEGVVWLVHGIVIKVGLNHMDDDDSVMYSVLNWESDEASVFGFGVPFRMRNPQRVINASWRMVLDNAGLSTGPQIVINKSMIEPADGKWELSPRKIWWMTSDDPRARVDYAMQTFTVDSRQQELTNIFEMAHRLADEETSLPQLNNQSSDQNQPAYMKTLGGTAMWMTSTNIMMRRAVKSFDDNVTVPFVTRFYDWNMQFNPKMEIKGDYCVDARGSSVLLAKEMQSRNIAEFVATAMSLPEGPMEINSRGVLEEFAKSLQISVDNVLVSKADKDAAAEQEQAPDPIMMKIEADKELAQMNNDARLAEQEAKRQIAMMERETKLMEIQADTDIKLEDIRSKAGIKKYDTDWKMTAFYEELKIKREQGITSNYGLEAEQ